MKIAIRSYLSGSFLLEQEPSVWDAIVILDSGCAHTNFVERQTRRHLYLQFDDVDTDLRGRHPPEIEDVRSALDFATCSQDLLVCCRAGRSRSAAMAFVICHQRLGPDAACRLLDPKRHQPNPLVLDLGARLIGDPLLLRTFLKWQVDHNCTKPCDYLDEAEQEIEALERRGARDRIADPSGAPMRNR